MNCENTLNHAKSEFEAFLSDYDLSDPKIQLKRTHTYEVVKVCEYLAHQLKLSDEDRMLALLIGLLHDIGRFVQLTKFDSYDDRNLDHAEAGVQLLFDERMIRRFIEEDQYDEIICKAILYHSAYQIENLKMTSQERLHAQIIRDADKLDNYRVKLTESVEAIMGRSPEEVEHSEISDVVYDTIFRHETVKRSDRITGADMWMSFQAFLFGLYFPESHRYLKERDLIRKNIRRISYRNPATIEKVNLIERELLIYNENHCI